MYRVLYSLITSAVGPIVPPFPSPKKTKKGTFSLEETRASSLPTASLMQALQPEVVHTARPGTGASPATRAEFSYTSLLPYPPQTLATLTATRLRRTAGRFDQESTNRSTINTNSPNTGPVLTSDHPTEMCFLNVGKSGSGSVIEGLSQASNISHMVVVHAALREPVLLRERSTRTGLTVRRFDGPFAEGLPSFSACVNTGQVVTWVRDPVSRFLSSWHSAVCFESECDQARTSLWEAAAAMQLVTSSTTATTLDLNMLLDELARRDGGEVPGQATFAFLRAIDDGITGLAAYLPDCSISFLRRHPLRFVGRAEHMEQDWLALFRKANTTAAPQLAQERMFVDPHPRRTLSRDSVNWLRTFYRDDYVCMKNLGEAELVPKDYVQEVSNSTVEYKYWGALSKKCFDLWRSGGLKKLAGDPETMPASAAGDARCSIEPWPRPLDRGKGAWEVNNLKLAKDFGLESHEPLNESFLPFNGGQSWTSEMGR